MSYRHRIEYKASLLGYRVNESGTLLFDGREVSTWRSGTGGYKCFTIPALPGRCMVHRLQAYQKFGEAVFAPGTHCRHLDGNTQNNSAENIAIGTATENSMDRPKAMRMRVALRASSFVRKYDHFAILAFHEGSYQKTREKFGIKSDAALHYILKKCLYRRTQKASTA